MDEDRFRSCSSKTARRRLRNLLVLAADYLKYLFMSRRRLLRRVARRTHAVLSSYHGKSNKCLPPYCPPRALMEHEFSCSDSPSPAFLAAKRLQSRLKRGAAAGAAVSSCFGTTGSPPATEEDGVVEEEDDADVWECYGLEPDVDYRAEEFITMFYEQLRAQNIPPVLQRSP
ncbi:hypothetical protein D1007_18401 [Hordeum vulgare]|nr:hypothetical protein D1007_18401 [Hordeum vulgare]